MGERTERQAYALANVATDVNNVLNPQLQTVEQHRRGWNLLTILAVDR